MSTFKTFSFLECILLLAITLTLVTSNPSAIYAQTISLWSNTTLPQTPVSNDPQPTEVGVQFKSSQNGVVRAIRFYRGTHQNGVPYKVNLWRSDGVLLGTGTAANLTRPVPGWQEISLNYPVSISANEVYTASYYTAQGNYPFTQNYFNTASTTNGVLTAPSTNSVAGGNGVYRYGVGGGLPTGSYKGTNYWVDVVFTAQPYGAKITSLNILNSATNQVISDNENVTENITVNLASLTNTNLSIKASASQAKVGSVSFFWNGQLLKIDNYAPYSLEQNIANTFIENNQLVSRTWIPTVGEHTLMIVPHQRQRGQGYAGTPLVVKVLIVNNPPAAPWQERILNADNTINWAEWANLAANYNTQAAIDYRLGPKYSDYNPSAENFPTIYQPDPQGLLRGGTDLVLANRYCVTPDRLPRNEEDEFSIYDGGGGWQMSGQLLFSPDVNHPRYNTAFRFGSANMRNFDGAMARKLENGQLVTRGLCMRLRAEWYPDWWNRNQISTPSSPGVQQLATQNPAQPLPPVATTRGGGQASVTGFLAYQNGVIQVAGTGNDNYTTNGGIYPRMQLPAGLVPTAIATTPQNEFVFVTVWNTAAQKGQVAVIAVGVDYNEPATVPGGWGVQNWPVVKALKLLGLIDLPFAAPNAISVTNSISPGTLRGTRVVEEGRLLTQQSQRDYYRNLPWRPIGDEDRFKVLAHAGYAMVSSRAENKVAFINLRPLFDYYRKMYLTTQERFDQTAVSNQGPAPNQWPYTFETAPEQIPTVLGVLNIPQPTAIHANIRPGYPGTRAPDNDFEAKYRRALIASMDGTVRMYNVESLGDPTKTPVLPTQPIKTVTVGKNPLQIASPIKGDLINDDIFIVSRGGRSIHIFDYNLNPIDVLRDKRMKDPVFVAIGVNGAGYGGSGRNYAFGTRVLTVLDYNGQQVIDYGMRWGSRTDINADHPSGEEWNYVDGQGNRIRFIHGFSNPLPGKPFMFSFDEVI
jgi:hypothetical protein